MQMKNFKEDFPLLRENPVVYLDSAATAQRPESVINSEMEFYKKCNANPLRGLYDLGFKATECYEQSRETVRKFINARSERENNIYTQCNREPQSCCLQLRNEFSKKR